MDYFKFVFDDELKKCQFDMQETKGFVNVTSWSSYKYDFVIDDMVPDTLRKTHVKIWIRDRIKYLYVAESYYVLIRDLNEYLEKIKDYLLEEKGLELHSEKFDSDVQYYVCIPIDT